jgi:hypothetical protein
MHRYFMATRHNDEKTENSTAGGKNKSMSERVDRWDGSTSSVANQQGENMKFDGRNMAADGGAVRN